MRRKEERSKHGQTNKQGKATQHTQGSHFSWEKMSYMYLRWDSTHDTPYSRQSALPLSYQGSSAGWAQISHLIINLMNGLTYMYRYMYMYMCTIQGYIHVQCIYMYSTCLSDLWSYEGGRGREGGREGGKVGGREGYCVVKQYTVYTCIYMTKLMNQNSLLAANSCMYIYMYM